METKQVTTKQERSEFEEFQAWKAQKEREQARKENREAYRTMVDEVLAAVVPTLQQVSEGLKMSKRRVFEQFSELIALKSDVLGLTSEGQRSHTFTNSDGTKRIILGYHTADGYLDTVDDGIQMVKNYLEGLVENQNSKALVSMVLKLLAKDAQGNIKASRVMQLKRVAEESKSEEFLEGVRVIEESYLPSLSKRYIRCEVKDSMTNAWVNVPLGMTDVMDIVDDGKEGEHE